MAEQNQNLVIIKKLTTINDNNILNVITLITRECIESVVKQLKIDPIQSITGNTIFFMTLAKEIAKDIRNIPLEGYSVVVGKDFDTVIRYERNSLASFKWNGIQIRIYKCPPNPVHSLDEGEAFVVKEPIDKRYS